MTTSVTVQAHCGEEKEVSVSINDGENHILEDGQKQEFFAYDERVISVKEQAKQGT